MCLLVTTTVISDITFLTADPNACQNPPPLKIYFEILMEEGRGGKSAYGCFWWMWCACFVCSRVKHHPSYPENRADRLPQETATQTFFLGLLVGGTGTDDVFNQKTITWTLNLKRPQGNQSEEADQLFPPSCLAGTKSWWTNLLVDEHICCFVI